MRHRWHRFRALPRREQVLTLEATAWLALAAALLALVPFRHIARRQGSLNGEREPETDCATARAVGRAVKRAARHLPWHPVCLPQALAARAMLRRRGIPSSLYFGMRLDGDDRAMRAHAWVTAGTTGVVGVPTPGQFTVLARYSR